MNYTTSSGKDILKMIGFFWELLNTNGETEEEKYEEFCRKKEVVKELKQESEEKK